MTDAPRIFISYGNKKLPADTGIFNIPARVTCPGRTAFCAGACYALKAERLYKAVLPARTVNFDATRRPDFAARMIELIGAAYDRGRIKRFRVHESGDFYSQSYLNAWFNVARAVPGVRFYAYTKSFHLDFSGRPGNFWLLGSFDKSTTAASRAAWERVRGSFQHTFTIVERDARAVCEQDCSVCDACWTRSGRKITVNRH